MNTPARLNRRPKRSQQIIRRRERRRHHVSLELLEPRTLLSADVACTFLDTAVAKSEVAKATSQLDLPQLGSGIVGAADAGSTFGTAEALGELSGLQTFYGSVGRRDPADVVRFSLSDEADVVIQLRGLRSDIDLALYDNHGQRIGLSNQAGAASESISLSLESGIYYVGITPWRRASSSYMLSTSVELTTLPPSDRTDAPGSDAANPDAANPDALNPDSLNPDAPVPPNSTDLPDASELTEPGDGDDAVTEFQDVAYYGGSDEWNLNAINAPESWAEGYTGSGVTVAVIDTGVDLDHADLVNQIWVNPSEVPGNGIDDDQNGYVDDVNGWDFVGNDNSANDRNGHGTHVAGTIAAGQNGFGATGVAPGTTIMPVRVLDGNGYGTDSAVAAGIRYAAENGADIINLSLGGTFSFVIQSAIRFAEQLDVLVVAASGNEYASVPSYPARLSDSLSNLISVGAYSRSDRIAGFSNDVGSSDAVQVDAPGVSVYSTYSGGRYAARSGTSMAAPHVAGLAALALSANSDLSANELRGLIVDGANQTIAGSDSYGGINAAVTVAFAAAGQTANVAASSAVESAIPAQWFFTPWSFITSTSLPGDVVQIVNQVGIAQGPMERMADATSGPVEEFARSSDLHDRALQVLLAANATSAYVTDDIEASVTDILAASASGRFDRANALSGLSGEDWTAISEGMDTAFR